MRVFPSSRHVEGMPLRPPPGPLAQPPASVRPTPLMTQAIYTAHWRYVFRLLPGYGIRDREEARNVAQTVWMTVHMRIETYAAEIHRTPRAWLTGIVRRCAANHRRASRQRAAEVLTEDPGALITAPGLDPEEAALLRTLEQAIRDEDRREALILQVRHGLSIEEIAAAQGVSEHVIERRLHMAREELKDGGDEKKSGAFLGFGSFDALADALRPKKPIPDEEGTALWERIAEQIRQQEADSAGAQHEAPSLPPSSIPPAAVPVMGPIGQPAAVLTLTKGMVALLLAGAFAAGAGAGAGGVLAWQAHAGQRHGDGKPVVEVEHPARAGTGDTIRSVAAAPSSAGPLLGATAVEPAPPLPSNKSAAARSTSASPAPGVVSSSSVVLSNLLILRMRRASEAGDLDLVLSLADQHARQFPGEHVGERESERIGALRRLGHGQRAEQLARTTAETHPQHRGAMERAVGHALR